MIYINGRFLTQRLTGSQRFAYEILTQLLRSPSKNYCVLVPLATIESAYEVQDWPIKYVGRLKGTIWEQVDLPIFLYTHGSPLLINLVNTAPCVYKNQIVTIMDMTTFVNPKWFKRSFASYYKLVLPIIARNSLKIITVSEHSKKDILRYINVPAAKVEVIYCAVSQKFLATARGSSMGDEILKRLGVRKNSFILGVSSLDPRKNFKVLIAAYLKLNGEFPLIIVGSKGHAFASSDLDSLTSGRSNIIFTGYLLDEELVSLYKFARCFVYPSLYEGFGLPPLEAMACGCPTIVADTSSIPEVCGNASIYVDPNDTTALKNVLSDLISDDLKRESLTLRGYDREKAFSWQASCVRLKNLLEQVV